MGLRFPLDLAAWQRWHHRRNRLRWAKDLVRRPESPELVLSVRGDRPTVLFALDATTPTALASVTEPLIHLGELAAAVLAPADVSNRLPGDWSVHHLGTRTTPPRGLQDVRVILSAGHFLPAGSRAFAWAQAVGADYVVVQHGLLTPFAPPLPPRSTLLAFSAADADFWIGSRPDVAATVVGSQLLWHAGGRRVEPADGAAPLFLGQLHGAELPRRISARTAEDFCRRTGATYRPHPAETDIRSRLQHRLWQRKGIDIQHGGPLLAAGRPVVAVFSTGVLEAAAAGLPAWVTCVDPPRWVREFWDRYQLSPWGGEPTPKPSVPPVEPALSVAQRVREIVGGR